MKRIIFMLIILLLAACEAQSPKKNAIIQSDPVGVDESEPVQPASAPTSEPEPTESDEPVIPDDPEYFQPTENRAELVYFDGANTYVYDGTTSKLWCSGKTTPAGFHMFCNGTTLYTVDDYAGVVKSVNIATVYDFAVVTSDGTYWGADQISPADAYTAGAKYKDYVCVFCNGVEYGVWTDRQYYLSDFVSRNNDVFAIKSTGAYEHINGTVEAKYVSDDLIITGFSASGKYAYFNGEYVDWTLNFMNNANYWLYCASENKYVSQNGYIWFDPGMMENGNKMTEFRLTPYPIDGLSGAPFVVSVGSRNVNGDDLLYWIECNTGWLFAYNVRLDTIATVKRLYVGDGTRETGVAYSEVINPVLSSSGDVIAFTMTDGYVYEYKFNTNLVRQLFAVPVWIRGM